MTWRNPKKISPPKDGQQFLALLQYPDFLDKKPFAAVLDYFEKYDLFENEDGKTYREEHIIAWRPIPSLPMNWRKDKE